MSVTPFGETAPTGSLEFNLRFSGQYFDNETGTHYNINRDYNPITGRYIQSDPIGLDGGFSTFAYVNGNPVMFVDLEGLTGSENYQENLVDLLKDILSSPDVSSDITKLIIVIEYDKEYMGDLNGVDVKGQTVPFKGGGSIVLYRRVWEFENGNKREGRNGRMVYALFHELQHLRKNTNWHPATYVTEIFRAAVAAQYINFTNGSGSSWVE